MPEASSRKLIAGNWKMNGIGASVVEAEKLAAALRAEPASVRVALCPPATLIERMARAMAGTSVEIGAQDCRSEASGAFTGDVSAEMVREAGATLVILGHSERRTLHGETNAVVRAKVEAAIRAGLEPIVCVGETLDERKAGRADVVVSSQLAGSLPDELADYPFAIAYEPVWAIGTGLTPTLDEIGVMHIVIRTVLMARFGDAGGQVPILYGGSVKGSNAAEIMALAAVGGALVGGASLKSDDFLPIVRAG